MSELKTILYVEDQKDIQVVTKYALESISNFELKICDNGEEALELLNQYVPNLILMDVMMPVLDGPATLIQIRQRDNLKNIPIIFMTAKILPNEVSELINLGAVGVIAKPFDPITLGDQILDIYTKSIT